MKKKSLHKPVYLRQFQPVRALLLKTGLFLLAFLWLLSACEVRRSPTNTPVLTMPVQMAVLTSTQTPVSTLVKTATLEFVKPVVTSTSTTILEDTQRVEPTPTVVLMPTASGTNFVEPTQTPVSSPTESDSTYPGPNEIPPYNPETYPGLNEGQEYPSTTGGIFSTGGQTNPTVPPTQVQVTATLIPTVSLIQRPTATPLSTGISGNFSPRFLPQSGTNQILTIWHSLGYPELAALEDIIRAFQDTSPQTSFDLTYIPRDDLRKSYADAVYLGGGPDLLLAPSEWAAEFFDRDLAANLKPYFPASFWRGIISVALETGQYRGAQVSLPVTMSGAVLYRNTGILPHSSADFESMVNAAHQVTRGGIVGAYFDLDPFYSMAHLEGLGGKWQDASGQPVFQRQNYTVALDWIEMLQDFDRLGAVEVNTSRDLNLFRQGKVGLILDGTWNMVAIAQALGRENLAIDAWPEYGTGRLSGYVSSQGLYLNVRTAAEVDPKLLAALQFMGTVLLPQSQQRLSEVNTLLPVLKTVQTPDGLKNQAVSALQDGTAFPPVLYGPAFEIYRSALQTTISQSLGLPPYQPKSGVAALQEAYGIISDWIANQNN